MKNSIHILFVVVMIISTSILKGQQTPEIEFSKLDKELQKNFVDKFGFSLIIADEQKVLFRKEYGYIDSLKTKLVDDRTLFNIASITKTFTAMAIMRLVEQKKLNLSDSIGMFFKNVPIDKQSITIHNLLTHQAGFQQNYVCDGIKDRQKALNALLGDTLSFVPGASFQYSNENYEMLAIIIETVAKTTYEDFIRREILIPLGMKTTYFWNEVDNIKNIAEKNRNLGDEILQRNWGYIGSGGIYTTADDLYRFFTAFISTKIITEESIKIMLAEYYRTKSGIGITYGCFINDTTDWNTKEIATRGNEDWGHNASLRWFTNKHKIIVILTNSGEIGKEHTTANKIISNYIADYLWKNK